MTRFVIGTNRTTPEQDQAFLKILQARWPHLGWWHQLSETWLIVDLTGELTAIQLRDAANEAFPGIYKMVLDVGNPHNWAAFGRTEDFPWMRDEWERLG